MMTILVAGAAALFDLILSAGGAPEPSSVGTLSQSSGAAAAWLPGGAALTIALAMRRHGCKTALFHPLPADALAAPVRRRLGRAGVDVSRAPVGDVARCLIVQQPGGRLAWSGAPVTEMMHVTDTLLDHVSHVVIAPRWGAWTDELLAAALERSIPVSLIGEPPPESSVHRWHCVVLDERQVASSPSIDTAFLVVTRGAEGASIHDGERTFQVKPVPVAALDPTGAGDVFGAVFLACQLTGSDPAAAGRQAAAAAATTCLGWGAWAGLDDTPPAAGGTLQSRIRGALLGLACGDAFGMPNSFLRAPAWRRVMEPGPADSPYHAGYAAGRVTDDTEQALALTNALEDGFSAGQVATRLCEWFVAVGGEASLAVGPSTRRAMQAFQSGTDVALIGRSGVTNGAAMRVAPIGVYAALRGFSLPALIDHVEMACMPTHHTTPAIAGAAAIAAAVAAGIAGSDWDQVMQAALQAARLGGERGTWIYAPDMPARIALARRMAASCGSDQDLLAAMSDTVGAGEATTEAVPAALGIADYAQGDPERAIRMAGNLRGDTDTVAAMAGAVCGAFSGDAALPAEWTDCVQSANALDVAQWADRLRRCAERDAKAFG